MNEQKKDYTKPVIDLLTFLGDPIMLSYGQDPNQGAWTLLMQGVDQNV